MPRDTEIGAVDIEIALVAAAPGVAAALVRDLAPRTAPEARGELTEPEPGKQRIVRFASLRALANGDVVRTRVNAMVSTSREPPTPAEWRALLDRAAAVIQIDRHVPGLDEHLSHRDLTVIRTNVAALDAAIDGVVAAALIDAAGPPEAAGGAAPQAFVTIQCPWCFEQIEIAVEADVEGSYVQDCEVCCRPWALSVSRDEDGALSVEVGR